MTLLAAEAPRSDTADDALDRLAALVGPDLDAVNATILDRMQSDVPVIPMLARHIIEGGGKRLRPMLTLAAARLCGYNGPHHVLLATAVEFIHTATLLHDDVVDKSDLRRGKTAAHLIWGNPASVLVGDFLYARAFQLMVETGSVDVLGVLADASAVIASGEVMQLAASKDLGTTEETYLKVIAAKTAALFAAAAESGARAAKASDAHVAALRAYGLQLGIAFQLVDDALDYGQASAKLGKNTGDDFREGKITLPVILAHARGAADERNFWKRTMADGQQQDGDLTVAMELMAVRDALDDTMARAREAAGRAKAALNPLPAGPYRSALEGLADFCVARAY